ncbi:major facilitator superfamily domain-containing protein 10-like [Gigantopelta aegis]|uniref:major facilitator superfamily domain-containing protein 10-like n=1 Tax=Gigantopelta aegis TaxID=1735272 RepID=UPI001B88DF7F|nr:major facilitator superfamily domain-containing protein 10-like [Gigantopelta aegis]
MTSRVSNNNNGMSTQSKVKELSPVQFDEKRMNRVLHTIFVILVVDLLAFTVILPLLPSLLDHYGMFKGTRDFYKVLHNSVQSFRVFVGAPDTPRWNGVLFGGLIGSLFSFLQFLSSPMIGAASDIYGRKPMMLLCMVGVAISYAVWAVSSNFTLFVLARVIGGISKGNISLSTAIVADVSTPEKRGKGMAMIGIAFSIGFVFGPSIGAMFSLVAKDSTLFYVLPALFALVLAVSDILLVKLYLEETLPPQKRAKAVESIFHNASQFINPVSLFNFSPVKDLKEENYKSVRRIGVVYFLFLFIYSGLEFTLPFLMYNRFQYGSMQQGKMFLFIGTVMALVQGGYVRRVKAGKELKVAAQGILLLIPSFLLMAYTSSIYAMYFGLALFSFGSATVVPCLTTLLSIHGRVDQKGAIMGIFRSLGALARAVGPVCASTVYWSCGEAVCYCTGGVCMFLPLVLVIGMKTVKPVSD